MKTQVELRHFAFYDASRQFSGHVFTMVVFVDSRLALKDAILAVDAEPWRGWWTVSKVYASQAPELVAWHVPARLALPLHLRPAVEP